MRDTRYRPAAYRAKLRNYRMFSFKSGLRIIVFFDESSCQWIADAYHDRSRFRPSKRLASSFGPHIKRSPESKREAIQFLRLALAIAKNPAVGKVKDRILPGVDQWAATKSW